MPHELHPPSKPSRGSPSRLSRKEEEFGARELSALHRREQEQGPLLQLLSAQGGGEGSEPLGSPAVIQN